MQLKVYRQASKERPSGQTVYKGEDARPYVGETCFFVADGLGGASAIRHTKFDPNLFQEDKLVATLFHDVFSTLDDAELNQYVINSFYEFTSIKDIYFDTTMNYKKSGYFASRLVTSIFLHEMKYNPQLSNVNALFQGYHALNTAEQKRAFLQALGELVKTTIQLKLQQSAQNGNIIYESNFEGLALLGTTLCATLYRDRKDYVEAIYFVAGDSRPYMWNADGLFQIVADQEGADGGMTNYIRANEDAQFYIDCQYRKFQKPCILFNASDGCFDSKYFLNQMAFEKLLLESIVECHDMEEVETSLTNTFYEYGKHDDSSTIALKAFGFDSYEQLQQEAQKRLATITAQYIDEMPDLLDTDYHLMEAEIQEEKTLKAKELRRDLANDEGVIAYCKQQIVNSEYPVFAQKMVAVKDKLASFDAERDQLVSSLIPIIQKNYYLFAKKFNVPVTLRMGDVEYAYSEYRRGWEQLVKYATGDLSDSQLEQFKKVNVSPSLLEKIKEDFFRRNTKRAIKDAEFDKIVADTLQGEFDEGTISQFVFGKKDQATFLAVFAQIKALDAQIVELTENVTEAIVAECVPSYYQDHFDAIVDRVADGTIIIDEAKKAKLDNYLSLNSDGDLAEKIARQSSIFDRYDANYLSLLDVDFIADGEEVEEDLTESLEQGTGTTATDPNQDQSQQNTSEGEGVATTDDTTEEAKPEDQTTGEPLTDGNGSEQDTQE